METDDACVRFCRRTCFQAGTLRFGGTDHDFSRRRPTRSQRTPYDLCSRVWPRGCDPVEHARFHLFRNVLRVRLKADLTTLRRWERLLQLALPTTAPYFILWFVAQ